ncbi:hypothetical protein TcG_12007, partial [Trypanosoma cruzi]
RAKTDDALSVTRPFGAGDSVLCNCLLHAVGFRGCDASGRGRGAWVNGRNGLGRACATCLRRPGKHKNSHHPARNGRGLSPYTGLGVAKKKKKKSEKEREKV